MRPCTVGTADPFLYGREQPPKPLRGVRVFYPGDGLQNQRLCTFGRPLSPELAPTPDQGPCADGQPLTSSEDFSSLPASCRSANATIFARPVMLASVLASSSRRDMTASRVVRFNSERVPTVLSTE